MREREREMSGGSTTGSNRPKPILTITSSSKTTTTDITTLTENLGNDPNQRNDMEDAGESLAEIKPIRGLDSSSSSERDAADSLPGGLPTNDPFAQTQEQSSPVSSRGIINDMIADAEDYEKAHQDLSSTTRSSTMADNAGIQSNRAQHAAGIAGGVLGFVAKGAVGTALGVVGLGVEVESTVIDELEDREKAHQKKLDKISEKAKKDMERKLAEKEAKRKEKADNQATGGQSTTGSDGGGQSTENANGGSGSDENNGQSTEDDNNGQCTAGTDANGQCTEGSDGGAEAGGAKPKYVDPDSNSGPSPLSAREEARLRNLQPHTTRTGNLIHVARDGVETMAGYVGTQVNNSLRDPADPDSTTGMSGSVHQPNGPGNVDYLDGPTGFASRRDDSKMGIGTGHSDGTVHVPGTSSGGSLSRKTTRAKSPFSGKKLALLGSRHVASTNACTTLVKRVCGANNVHKSRFKCMLAKQLLKRYNKDHNPSACQKKLLRLR